jgi:hypothetical protein
MWGQVENVGKGTKANYNPAKKTITFTFNRGPDKSGEILRAQREKLMKQLSQLCYPSRMAYNGEVVVENVTEEDIVLEKKNHKLIIHLNKKMTAEEKAAQKPPAVEEDKQQGSGISWSKT